MKFEDFFFEAHGVLPFPWQVAAANRLQELNDFVVTVPTSMGKTALIDAALFAAAQPTNEHSIAARRIFFIVDRRIVVDEAYIRTQRIVEALRNGEGILSEMNRRLGEIQVVRLRGGMYQNDDWVLYPDKVTVVLSTVDQVGSRLLQRGYGVSPRRWSMHAGFVGNGSLFIVDEAHISQPFLNTIESTVAAGAKVRTIAMSATLPTNSLDRVELTEADRANPIIAKRLKASKIATLQSVPANEASFVKAAVALALSLIEPTRPKIAVVVNRVATARAIFKQLEKKGHRAALLTGRMRPFDRDRMLKNFLPEVMAGRNRSLDNSPLFLVTTQAMEVGANLDFDGIVSEAAPLSSLLQRFGRDDRLGELGLTRAIILFRDTANDPVYGTSLKEAWSYLQSIAVSDQVDFGLQSWQNIIRECPPPHEPVDPAPTLLPAHFALLAQTGEYAPFVDVSPWLHGRSSKAPEVTVIWRSDLTEDDSSHWAQCAQLMPPELREGLQMPSSYIRRWLAEQPVKGGERILSDLEGEAITSSIIKQSGTRSVLRWRGRDDCVVIESNDIRPGDTIIVPATYGACDCWGWSPDSKKPVEDLAEACLFEEGVPLKRRAIRLTEECFSGVLYDAGVLHAVMELKALEIDATNSLEDMTNAMADALERLRQAVTTSTIPMLQDLGSSLTFDEHPQGFVVRARVHDDLDYMLEAGVSVTLDTHLQNVVRMTELLSSDHEAKMKLSASAKIHDVGKDEWRMQILLYGNEMQAEVGPALAKSGMKTRRQRIAAYKASGLPNGYRHEFGSLDMSGVSDPLVRHLVATHHGHGRPWIRVCDDEAAPGASYATLASHWLEAFATQVEVNGLWSLAEMELLLRAADTRASIEESENANN